MVLKSSLADPVMLLAPVDSGIWELQCNSSEAHGYDVDCAAVSDATVRRTGVAEHFKHLIMPCHKFWNSTYIVDLLFARWYSNETVMLSEYDIRSVYLEGGVAGQLPLPSGVRFVLASLPALFGTEEAAELRAVCVAKGWPLLWALGTNDHSHNSTYSVATRVVDPDVAKDLPLDVSLESLAAREAFGALWREAQAARANGTVPAKAWKNPEFWERTWSALTGTLPASMVLRPLSARQCRDMDDCIGVTTSNLECVCLHRHPTAFLPPTSWQSTAALV